MSIRLGVVMDPIASINYHKDSTLAMLWEAADRGWEIYYFEQQHLFLRDGVAYGEAQRLTLFRDPNNWFKLDEKRVIALTELDMLLMRKDPPFNEEYIYTTYLLEYAEQAGVLVINRPQSLRDANEKFFINYFPPFIPPTLITQSVAKLRAFWLEQKDIVCKPLNGMGGASVFRLRENEVNANVIFDTLTRNGSLFIMAQRFIPDIDQGDKRILIIDGEAVPYVLSRVPQGEDWRGNMAVGAKGKVQPLSDRDRSICAAVGPVLKARGLYFAGLDIIGDYLTEINITSPTGIREIDAQSNTKIAKLFFDRMLKYIKKNKS